MLTAAVFDIAVFRFLYLETRTPGEEWPAWHAGAVHVRVTPLIVNASGLALSGPAGRGALAEGSFGVPVQVLRWLWWRCTMWISSLQVAVTAGGTVGALRAAAGRALSLEGRCRLIVVNQACQMLTCFDLVLNGLIRILCLWCWMMTLWQFRVCLNQHRVR